MDDAASLDRLVPAGDAFERLANEYDRRGDYASFEVCRKVALDTLITRLKNRHLTAWTTHCSIASDLPRNSATSSGDFHQHSGAPAIIPYQFWTHFHWANDNCRTFEPVAGDFSFEYTDDDYSRREGSAFNVLFDPSGLPPAAVPWQGASAESNPHRSTIASATPQKSKGRPPASWWPGFAEELVVYVHNHGLPSTQEALIAGVFEALAQQGKDEPSRTQVQPVVRQLFDRLS